MLYTVGCFLIFIIGDLVFRKIIIDGRENIPRNGGYIIASNHVSYFDPVVIGYALWIKSRLTLNYLAKAQLAKSSFLRWFFKELYVDFVERGKGNRVTLEKALALLKNGKSILIFPEGSTIPEHQRISSGVGFLAIKSGRPVLPVKVEIFGYYRAKGFWPLFVMILKWFFINGYVEVKFGTVIRCDSENLQRREITKLVMKKISSL